MKKLTILDGGMGRELQDIGAPFSQPLWSAQALIESPEHVRQAHQNFIDAGAEIIITNSYACVPFHLGDDLYQTQGAQLARDAARIAHDVAATSANPDLEVITDNNKLDGSNNSEKNRACHSKVLVAGAIPPPFGSYRPDLFKAEEAKTIIQTLVNAQERYVDIWIVETISSLEEFKTIKSVLQQSELDAYYAFSLSDEAHGHAALRSGQCVKTATEMVCASGAKGIMFNCSVPEVMEKAIITAKDVISHSNSDIDIDIGVYANNFMPIKAEHKANGTLQAMREMTPEEHLVYAKRWYQLGATIIGGCCGIGPSHIKALSEWQQTLSFDDSL
ncbi:homocysteine S-methyltransferase family protein [Vibrio sp. 99-70-13A1]|uniref:homocysteine S-methyltransferase family protein n=1 Tax=Vibrio sp. 99-70-13A1 TaxID=2607601 RepID=UPI0014932D7E|nr:homocysteine S-methyltransferase family protein [Vibrio sp. 99-70-13A1]NOH97534.1 homocysteine S-methyltransferase family protein [Vibrio sp. 99-70-13A1]